MKSTIILAILAVCLIPTIAQMQSDPTSTDPNHTAAAQLSTLVVESISRAMKFLFELFDIKVRIVRFLASLYTTDNLILLRRVLHLALRFGNWLYQVIPESTNGGNSQLLSFLFPQVNLDNGIQQEDHTNDIPIENSNNNGVVGETETMSGGTEDSDALNDMMNLQRLINGRHC